MRHEHHPSKSKIRIAPWASPARTRWPLINETSVPWIPTIIVALALSGLAACGNTASTPVIPGPQACAEGTDYPSTFAAIEAAIFDRHGCRATACHGASIAGGLDLSPGRAWDNLIDVPSTASALPRVLPGDRRRSFLYDKLAAATDPGGVAIAGSPMPVGAAPLSADELEGVRLWIQGGAPREGTVPGTEQLLDACLPEPAPQLIQPLAAPAPGTGIQLTMPTFDLPSDAEVEYCFASWYDISNQVPAEFLDPTGQFFRFSRQTLRQDAQSHHLILSLAPIAPEQLDDPSFGAWTCKGGERAGQSCTPTDLDGCGTGLCGSEPEPTFACIGFGPPTGVPPVGGAIGGAQTAQAESRYPEGVYAQIPVRGVLYWNSHSFNQTDTATTMHAWLNYYFADSFERPLRTIFNTNAIFAASAPPFTSEVVCNDHVLPRGARLFELSSHVHRWGKHFWIDGPGGTRLYDNYVYNDPVYTRFDPPLAFDSTDAAARTLHYCVRYENGVNPDGSPDPETVARFSQVPDPSLGAGVFIDSSCEPVACVSGRVAAPCAGADDDASCDSATGAGDGWCDACPLRGGETTETEMFILLGQYYVVPPAGEP